MQDAASFLMIISGSANDIALRSEKPNSQQSIEYKAQAMAIISKRMVASQSFITDGTINACSMLAGTEVGCRSCIFFNQRGLDANFIRSIALIWNA